MEAYLLATWDLIGLDEVLFLAIAGVWYTSLASFLMILGFVKPHQRLSPQFSLVFFLFGIFKRSSSARPSIFSAPLWSLYHHCLPPLAQWGFCIVFSPSFLKLERNHLGRFYPPIHKRICARLPSTNPASLFDVSFGFIYSIVSTIFFFPALVILGNGFFLDLLFPQPFFNGYPPQNFDSFPPVAVTLIFPWWCFSRLGLPFGDGVIPCMFPTSTCVPFCRAWFPSSPFKNVSFSPLFSWPFFGAPSHSHVVMHTWPSVPFPFPPLCQTASPSSSQFSFPQPSVLS